MAAILVLAAMLVIGIAAVGIYNGLVRLNVHVVVGWNPGLVHRPTAVERTASFLYGNLPLAIPPLVFLGMLRLWRARGRDPDLAPIATRYEPPDRLTPAEVGTLVDGKPDMRDITATLVDLAVRGYVHLEHRLSAPRHNAQCTMHNAEERHGRWGL